MSKYLDKVFKKIKVYNQIKNNKLNKLKQINKKQRRVLAALSISIIFLVIAINNQNSFFSNHNSVSLNLGKSISARKASADLSDFPNIEKYMVPSANRTVVYVPQIHKEPTIEAQDKRNDQALIIQKEIYSILNKLVDQHHISYVMDETDLYGPMPQDKVSKIRTAFSDIDSFSESIKTTLDMYLKAGGSQQTADQIQKAANVRIDNFERNIYLTGGAAVLAAKNPDAHVYGSQNAATIAEARKQLQNIVHMENRINELKGQSQSSGSANSNNTQSSIQQIRAMFGNNNSGENLSLGPIADLAKTKNDIELQQQLNDVSLKLKRLSSNKTFETNSISSDTSDQVSQNPYQSWTNLPKLQQTYDNDYNKFMKLAKDQRSQEVSDNVIREMDENNLDTAVLVLGAQHKDQITSYLNSKNVNVIVITPSSELNYQG